MVACFAWVRKGAEWKNVRMLNYRISWVFVSATRRTSAQLWGGSFDTKIIRASHDLSRRDGSPPHLKLSAKGKPEECRVEDDDGCGQEPAEKHSEGTICEFAHF